MKEVIVAKTAGFCMGVKRAVEMTLKLAGKGKVYTYGPLIHNPQVIKLLEDNGVDVIKEGAGGVDGAVVIRTHGVPPGRKTALAETGADIYDATCPYVIKIQRIISEYSRKGCTIIIIGDKGHAEVDSYLGYAGAKGIVVSKEDELDKLRIAGRIIVVAQSTQSRERFDAIVKRLKGMYPDVCVFDTICNATSLRQEEAKDISRMVSAMVVVGGRNSANTLRLARICRESGVPTFFVERPQELNPEDLKEYEVIGVTAGASTSIETVRETACYIQGLEARREKNM